MSKFTSTLKEIWREILVYVATFAGVLLAQVVVPYKNSTPIDWGFHNGRVLVACLVSIYVVLQNETSVPPGVDPEAAKQGKKRNLKTRIANAAMHGFTWTTLIS